MAEGELAGRQLQRLRAVLAAVDGRNAFQTGRLRAAGLDASVASLADFSARCPLTTKAELVADQAAHRPYGSNLTFPLEHYTRFCQTSGTSGKPLVILDDNESWNWLLANWAHIYRAAGLQAGARVYFAFSFGPFLGFWTAFEAAAKLGFLCIPGGGLSTSARVRALLEHGATALCCTPTYALHLAEVARQERLDLSRSAVRTIIVAGEPGGSVPAVRVKIVEGWPGARVFDHYGMTEVGPVAYEDADQAGALEVIEESYFAEVLDTVTLQPVPPGETGELVLTTLGRTACPLLRYRTGDLVRRAPSGGGFRLAGGILGRVDDMVVVRGVNIYPAAVDAVVRSVPEIGEYRVRVRRAGALAELELEVEAASSHAAEVLAAALMAAFSLRIAVRTLPPGSLPRFELKARRWEVEGLAIPSAASAQGGS